LKGKNILDKKNVIGQPYQNSGMGRRGDTKIILRLADVYMD
jgi:hypothetical protein